MARRAAPPPSNRFLSPQALPQSRCRRDPLGMELFAEGQWQAIRALLERQGWSFLQIDLIHDQLRQGWPLALAKRHVAALTGFCPLRSRCDG